MERKFEEYIERLSPTLRRITYRLNGHFSFFNDDDLFQEAMEHLWVSFQKGSLDNKTDSFVLQGCYFHLKNYIRKMIDKAKLTSINSVIDEEGTTLEDILIAEDHSIEDAADNAMLGEKIEMGGLSKREGEILTLSLEGLTVREIGRRMGISHVMVIKIKKQIRVKCVVLSAGRGDGYQN